MSGVPAFKLVEAGFSQPQVEAARRSDLMEVKAEIKADIAELEHRLETRIGDVKAELKADISEVRADVAGVKGACWR